jgi:hypothetical protein
MEHARDQELLSLAYLQAYQARQHGRPRLLARRRDTQHDLTEEFPPFRGDHIDMMQDLLRDRAAGGIHNLDAEAVDPASDWDYDTPGGRLCHRMMIGIGREVERPEFDDEFITCGIINDTKGRLLRYCDGEDSRAQ